MKRLSILLALGTLALAGCSHLREPTDEQLVALLHNDRGLTVNAKPAVEYAAVECLKAWSGDADLLKGLAIRYAGEDGKKSCRTRVDGWIADSARNPEHYTFAELSAPKTVRRAMALQEAHALATMPQPVNQKIPAALTPSAVVPAEFRKPDPTLDLGVAGSQLQEAETLCQQIQKAAADPQAKPNVKKFAAYCVGSLRQQRATLEQAARSGKTAEQLEAIAKSANNLANIARELLAAGKR